MNNKQSYDFNFLNETSATEDLFEDKTHEKIADTLYEVIENKESDGITIGLEGGWGSGKSTVVSILKKKLEKAKNNTIYCYFDAWAHEGDHLRRVFLEALIDQIGTNDNELQEIKSRISNRKKVTHVKTNQTATALGKLLAMAAFLVPLGVALISGTLSKNGLHWRGETNWIFVVGLLFTLLPAIVLLCHGLRLLRSKKKLRELDNWMFLQGESKSITTQEVSEDEERSSIEFERYFNDIINVVFSKNRNAKLLIVVDNLDRVNASDSLKIWSTLQTFLQRRNPRNEADAFLQRIWVLVPYDEDGLEKLWRNHAIPQIKRCASDNSQDTIDDATSNECAKSFFDKCFQLRIEVPKLILTGWEAFSKDNIERALIGWHETDKYDVLAILKLTRKGVNDIPTPREIKTYINQVGLLRLHCDKDISTTSIAYFAVYKYIEFQKNREIENQLINGSLPLEKHKPFIPVQLTSELCGILFGVSAEKGQQLLLEPEIEKAFVKKEDKKIKNLSEIHKSAFWSVLNIHLSRLSDLTEMMNYASLIRKCLWDTASEKCASFVGYLKSKLDKIEFLPFPNTQNIDLYIDTFMLLDASNYNFSNVWGKIILSLNEQMKKKDFNFDNGNKILNDLISSQGQKVPTQHILSDVSFDSWIKWSIAANEKKYNSYLIIRPSYNTINDIASTITAGNPIPKGLYELITYMVASGETSWEPVFSAIREHIAWNQGNQTGIFSIEIFRILAELSSQGMDIPESFKQTITEGPFYNLASHLNAEGAIKYVALIMAKHFPGNIDSIQISPVHNSEQGLEDAKNFWKVNNTDNAQFIWNEVMKHSDFRLIWNLARNENNKLVGEIIRIAVKRNCIEFFNQDGALDLFQAAIQITDDDDDFNIELVRCFIANSQIEDEVVNATDMDIVKYAYELHFLIKYTQSIDVARNLETRLNQVTNEEWTKALHDDSHLTALAVAVKQKTSSLRLDDNLYEPLLAHLEKWINNGVTPSDAQKHELPELISILKDSFQSRLKDRLATQLININFKASLDAVKELIPNINVKKLVSEAKEKIQDATEVSIRTSNINVIQILDVILSHSDGVTFSPDKNLSEVLALPMKKLLTTNKKIDRSLIERLALKFAVDLSPNSKIDIIVSSAKYGKGNDMKDVTDIIKALISVADQEQITFSVTNETLGGDPLPNVVKELSIIYSYLGEEKSITVTEGGTVTLP